MAKSDCLVINRVKVDSDRVRDTTLVSPGVALADRLARVVNLVSDAVLDKQFLDILDDLIETSVVLQREKTALEWRDMDWEIKVGALGILLSHFEAVFKDRVHDTPDTK